jgi:hypothetical protein
LTGDSSPLRWTGAGPGEPGACGRESLLGGANGVIVSAEIKRGFNQGNFTISSSVILDDLERELELTDDSERDIFSKPFRTPLFVKSADKLG